MKELTYSELYKQVKEVSIFHRYFILETKLGNTLGYNSQIVRTKAIKNNFKRCDKTGLSGVLKLRPCGIDEYITNKLVFTK